MFKISCISVEQDSVFIKKDNDAASEQVIIPVIEEQVIINKKLVDTAKINVSKTVYEDTDQYSILLTEEHMSVERVPKNELVETLPPAVRYEGDVMIVPVLKEVAVVEKRIMLVEELRVTKYKTQKTEVHEVSLRRKDVEIKRTEINNT